ncbi:uncharacterized protein [Haliotis asinina]|uniref:uncharacterized protein n=1 Tax=Haliotis asinina TaxID=109174 RepID=UPI0035322EB2
MDPRRAPLKYQTACPKCLPSYLCVSREERRCASLVIHKKPNGSVSPKERNDIKEVRPEEMENAIPAKQLKNAPFLLNGYQTNWTECRISKNDRFSSMQSMTGSPSTSMVIFLLMHGLKYYIEQIEIPLQGTPQIQSKWKIPGQNQEDIKWESLHTGTCLNNKGKCLLLFGTAEICHHLIVYSLKEPSTDNAIVITGTARFTSDWANVFCSSWMFDNNENFGMALYWRIFEPKMYLITVNESRITLNVTQTPETVTLSLYNIQWHPSGRYGIAMRDNQLLLIHYKDNEQKIVQKVRVNSFRPGMAITKSLAVVCEDEVGRYTCKMNQFTK